MLWAGKETGKNRSKWSSNYATTNPASPAGKNTSKKRVQTEKIDLRLQEIEEEKGDLPETIKEQQKSIFKFNEKVDSCDIEIDELNKLKSDYNISISDFSFKMEKCLSR
jgi:predicted  nucleic acid-binding Zn-ribbon protein